MSVRNVLATTVAALCLTGCATPYSSINNPLTAAFGGYCDEPGPGELIKVGFSGNGLIDTKTVGTYLLYRSAEIAKRASKPYFAFYTNLPAAVLDRRSSEASAKSGRGQRNAHAYILFFDKPEPGLMETSDVLTRLAPTVKGEQKK